MSQPIYHPVDVKLFLFLLSFSSILIQIYIEQSPKHVPPFRCPRCVWHLCTGLLVDAGRCEIRETLPTENLLEDTEGLLRPRGSGGSNPSVTSRCGSLLPFASADARPSDDVIVFAGRRFVPMASLENVVDTMAAVKMNVMHLHASDFCRFSVESKLYPNLTAGKVYSAGTVFF